jgi:hypothetical protein
LDVDLLNFYQQGPFNQNPKLQTIEVPVSLELNPLSLALGTWKDIAFPKYEAIFRDLKAINADVMLKIGKHAPIKLTYEVKP